jgi:hypothetical protein
MKKIFLKDQNKKITRYGVEGVDGLARLTLYGPHFG